MDERVRRAERLCEQAAFAGGTGDSLAAAGRELDAAEADLALARGKLLNARFHAGAQDDPAGLDVLERAAELYRRLGDGRGEAEALCWIGIHHQFVRRDDKRAVPALRRAAELAGHAGDRRTLSYALRHLGIAEHAAGRLDAARQSLEESTRLRREIGLMAGVAANLVGLIYIAVAQGRSADARALAGEAHVIAAECGAGAILRQVAEARSVL